MRLRYLVYVDEMKLQLKEADHIEKIIKSPLDRTAHILGAFDEDKIAGTICVNFASLGLANFESVHSMQSFGEYFPDRVSVTTKLIVAPAYRNGSVALELIKAAYRIRLQGGILFDNIFFHPRRKVLAERLGYRQVFPNVVLPGYGESLSMVLVVRDWKYLLNLRSPLSEAIQDWKDDEGSTEFFHTRMIRQIQTVRVN